MTSLKRMLTVLVSLTLFLIIGVLFEPVALAQPAAASDADASTIRVLLSTGNLASQPFTVSGVYSIEERPDLYQLAEGNYNVSNNGGTLTLKNTDTGTVLADGLLTVTIKEHSNTSGTNLIGLAAKGKNMRYLGSMKFWPDGATVDAVNHVYLEKYLRGVVANEMGSSFPIEALKAQAVAARCYAIKTLEGSRGPHYDITDYAGTQAYSGYTTNSKINQAVNETAKKVLTYNGSIITAYFSASNGGQTDRTENVWSAALPYYKIRDDSYDLEKGPKDTVYFPVGTTANKAEDTPIIVHQQPEAIAEAYGASRVSIYQQPDTGSARLLSLRRGDKAIVYDMNSAWVKVKIGEKMGFIPTRYTRIYNLRASVVSSGRKLMPGASSRGRALLTLPKRAAVTLLSYGTWCYVDYNGIKGYISKSYVQLSKHAAPQNVTPASGNTFTVLSSTTLKSAAKSSGKTLAKLRSGSRVTLVSLGSSYYKVNYSGKIGYVSAKYLQLVMPLKTFDSISYSDTATDNGVRYSQDNMDSKLVDFIKTMAISSLNSANASLPDGQKYFTTPDSIKIKAIADMACLQTSHKPYCLHNAVSTDTAPHSAISCPSKDFTGVKMTVMLKVKKENTERQCGYDKIDYTWSFDFYIPDYLKSGSYPQWKVFDTGYRIYAVERGNNGRSIDCFKLVNRRNGHGIGLSQWGAYQRALDADSSISQYTSILNFYYPGTTLADLNISEALLSSVPTAPTPTPTATPTQEPTPTPTIPEPTPTPSPESTPSESPMPSESPAPSQTPAM